MADDFATLGKTTKAIDLYRQLADNAIEYAVWYLSLDENHLYNSYEECMRHFYILDDLCKGLSQLKDSKTGEEIPEAAHYNQKFEQLYQLLEKRMGRTPKEK